MTDTTQSSYGAHKQSGATGGATAGSSGNSQLDKTPGGSQQVLIARGGTTQVHDKEMGSHFSGSYQQPDHYETVQTQRNWFYSLRGGDLLHLQDQLEAAGLLIRGKYGRGIPGDETTEQAYEILLGRAVATHMTIDETLASASDAVKQFGGETGATRAPLVVQVTNPDDIKQAYQDQAQKELGRKLKPAELDTIVTLYQGLERTAQEQQYAMTGSGLPGGTGGTINAPPSLGTFTQQQIEQRFPTEFGAHEIANAGASFFSMLRGS